MIKDEPTIAAGALPSDTYAKMIEQAYAKYRVSPEYSAQNGVLFSVFDAGGWVRLGEGVRNLKVLPNMGYTGEPLFWLKLVSRGQEPHTRISVYIYRAEDVYTKHGFVCVLCQQHPLSRGEDLSDGVKFQARRKVLRAQHKHSGNPPPTSRRIKGALRLPFVCNNKRPPGLLECGVRNVSRLLEILPDLRVICLLAVQEDALALSLLNKLLPKCRGLDILGVTQQ